MNIFKYQLGKDRKYAGQGLGSFVNNLGIPLLKLRQEEEKNYKDYERKYNRNNAYKTYKKYKKEGQKQYNFIRRKLIKKKNLYVTNVEK